MDQYGNLIDRHNLWEMVGVRYRRALFPGFSDQAEFVFMCPATVALDEHETIGGTDVAFWVSSRATSTLHVTAELLYRKADQFLLNFLFGEESGITAPVTVMSEDQKTILVVLE